jgi:hypothetical protein
MPAEPVAKKKPVRKRPATVTYVDDKYGVSFHYPRKYALKASDQTKDQTKPESSGAEPLPMNFIESGGVHVVSVELPGSLYQGTDFVSGIFNVSVNKSLTSEQCGQFATSQKSENGPVSPLKVNFRGMEFSQLETTTDLTDTRYYHRFENGGCYEFALGLKTAEHESVESGVPVDDHDVFARLEKILATVHIKSELVPELTAGELAGSAGASNSSNR